MPGGASWILASLSIDQRARASGSPSGFLALIVRLVIEISMGTHATALVEACKAAVMLCADRRIGVAPMLAVPVGTLSSLHGC